MRVGSVTCARVRDPPPPRFRAKQFFLGPLSQQLELQRELAHTQQFMSYIDQCRGRETAAAAAAGAAADDAPERET